MSAFDIAIAVIIPVLFIAAVGFVIYRKVKRKGSIGCDCCDCSKCSGCPHCTAEQEEKKTTN